MCMCVCARACVCVRVRARVCSGRRSKISFIIIIILFFFFSFVEACTVVLFFFFFFFSPSHCTFVKKTVDFNFIIYFICIIYNLPFFGAVHWRQ